MRWPTHQAAALGLALTCHLPASGVAAALVGAILPDVLDQKLSGLAPGKRLKQTVFNKIHRGTTHWFGWWLALLLFVAWNPSHWGLPHWQHAPLLGIALGALSHVATDMLTPHGVPLLPVTRRLRVALPLCSTGSWREYVFLALCLLWTCWLLRPELLRFLRQL